MKSAVAVRQQGVPAKVLVTNTSYKDSHRDHWVPKCRHLHGLGRGPNQQAAGIHVAHLLAFDDEGFGNVHRMVRNLTSTMVVGGQT